MYNKHSVTLNISQNVCSHHAKPFVIQFVGQKTRFRTKATRVGRFLWKSTLAGTPDPPNWIAVMGGLLSFCVMAAYLWVYILDVDVAHLGRLWMIAGRFGF